MGTVYKIWLGSILMTLSAHSFAYEVETHAELSEAAFKISRLALDSSLLKDLGVNPTKPLINSEGEKRLIPDIVQDGARFEDNNIRPLFHFFDPLHDEGLFFSTSPNWALEDKGKIHLLQNYSFNDARDHLYKALTLPDNNERKKYFGKTFESLGRVIHHIQDMAQPQHVRLDPHLNLDWTDEELPFENRSRYESYSKDKGIRLPFANTYYNQNTPVVFPTARQFWTGGFNGDGRGLADFTNRGFVSAGTNFDTHRYPSPRMDDAVLREENANALLQSEGRTLPSGCLPPNTPCIMTFYGTAVNDMYRPGASAMNPRTSTQSIFDQDLKTRNLNPVFSLNHFNFDAAHQLLIPRAVAYSAGLIDYFFRGRLETEQAYFTDDGVSLTATLRVKNTIDPNGPTEWRTEALHAVSGQTRSAFTLTCQYTLNGQDQFYASPTVFMDAGSDPAIAPGQVSRQNYTFTLPSVPGSATNVQFRLVFRGKLGQEEGAVAVGAVNLATGFLITPNYPPSDGIGGRRAIVKKGAQWRLDTRPGRVAGNIDWKGWYVGGKPTKVLSWQGPKARYFGEYSGYYDTRFVFLKEIFQAGEIFALTPYPVLGAALSRDANGDEWLIAICQDGANEVVLRRPNKKSDSADLYDPVLAPEGWQEIGRSNVSAMLGVFVDPDVPWFFNGDGTEAQTVRRKLELIIIGGQGRNRYVGSERLKITITGASATLTPLGNLPGTKVITACENKAPINGCQMEAFYRNTQTRSGQYIIAVDYIDNQEVLALVSDDRSNSYDNSVEITSDSPGSCQTSTTKYSMFAKESGQLDLKVNGNSLVLKKVSNDSAYVAERVDVYFSRSGNTIQTSSYTMESGEIDALDLRYGLIAGGQIKDINHVNWNCSGPWNALCPTPGTITTSREISSAVNSNLGNRGIFSTSSGETSEFRMYQGFIIGISACINVGETVEYPDPRDFVTDRPGSWLVDSNDNLLVSQMYHDPNWVLRSFNYLTDGDLAQVVPAATQDAVYFPAGVIR